MTDVSINVSGTMDSVPDAKSQLPTNLFQLPMRSLPQAKEWLLHRRQHIRPWLQFVQTSNFKVAPNLPRLSKRIMRNIEYFQSNYLFVFLGLITYCLVTSPLLLLAVAGSFYAGFRLSKRSQDKKLILFSHELTLAQQYGLVVVCSMPIYYLAGAGEVVFWVLGASFFLITLHAALYNIDALISEEDDTFGLTQQV